MSGETLEVAQRTGFPSIGIVCDVTKIPCASVYVLQEPRRYVTIDQENTPIPQRCRLGDFVTFEVNNGVASVHQRMEPLCPIQLRGHSLLAQTEVSVVGSTPCYEEADHTVHHLVLSPQFGAVLFNMDLVKNPFIERKYKVWVERTDGHIVHRGDPVDWCVCTSEPVICIEDETEKEVSSDENVYQHNHTNETPILEWSFKREDDEEGCDVKAVKTEADLFWNGQEQSMTDWHSTVDIKTEVDDTVNEGHAGCNNVEEEETGEEGSIKTLSDSFSSIQELCSSDEYSSIRSQKRLDGMHLLVDLLGQQTNVTGSGMTEAEPSVISAVRSPPLSASPDQAGAVKTASAVDLFFESHIDFTTPIQPTYVDPNAVLLKSMDELLELLWNPPTLRRVIEVVNPAAFTKLAQLVEERGLMDDAVSMSETSSGTEQPPQYPSS